jgi:two-component system, response regulator YesN
MIVDDMEIMRKQIKRLPIWGESSEFCITVEAEDGQDALFKLQRQNVDLVITDIKMPRINGIELLKEVNENCLASCVVFLSEHSEFTFAREAIQYGIFDYLVKPVNPEELEDLLKKVKKNIEEKRKSQNQVKKLEEKLMEKIEIYYPSNHINSIIKYVFEGNIKVIEIVSIMVEDTFAALEGDSMKTALVLQKAYIEIWEAIKTRHNWIEQFVDMDYYNEIFLTQYNNIDLMKKELIEVIESIIALRNRFILHSKKSLLIEEICEFSVRNVEKKISLVKISDALFVTKNYIGDVFKKETGMTVGEYITKIKLERAKQLVAKSSLKSYEIAERLGYSDVEYFGKLFKKYTGVSPIEFKNMIKK